jgi:hypothetical protein
MCCASVLHGDVGKPGEIRRDRAAGGVESGHAGERAGERGVFAAPAFIGDHAGIEHRADSLPLSPPGAGRRTASPRRQHPWPAQPGHLPAAQPVFERKLQLAVGPVAGATQNGQRPPELLVPGDGQDSGTCADCSSAPARRSAGYCAVRKQPWFRRGSPGAPGVLRPGTVRTSCRSIRAHGAAGPIRSWRRSAPDRASSATGTRRAAHRR